MPNENDEWVFAPKCGRTSATIRVSYGDDPLERPDGVLLIQETPGGSNEAGWKITVAAAEKIKAAFAPPRDDFARIRQAGFADDAGFCGECLVFYCWTHWSVSTTGGGWCPEGHFKSIDPYCALDSD